MDIVYVANSGNNTVSVIDGKTNTLVAPTSTLTFNVDPPNAGDVYCLGNKVSNTIGKYGFGTPVICN